MTDIGASGRLATLTRRVHDGLRKLGEPVAEWPQTPAGIDVDVLIVGAGQCGLAAAFALKRLGIPNLRIVSAAESGQEGPWRSFARMPTLRSPKHAPGPELGMPDLTYESWHVARLGQQDYDALDLIPTEYWADYLDWFRITTGIQVQQNLSVIGIDGDNLSVRVDFSDGDALTARQVILATGMDALGAPSTPATLKNIPPALALSCYGEIDFGRLQGKSIAVIGAASTGFDNAAAALEAGAKSVDLYCREPELRAINHMKGVSDYGIVAHWADFDDAARWRLAHLGLSRSAPPILPTVQRACKWPNFRILMNASIEAAEAAIDIVMLQSGGIRRSYDSILLATGYGIEPSARPELHQIFDHMASWHNLYEPPTDLTDATLSAFPYLTSDFAFTERKAGAAPWLARVRLFAGPAVVSMGRVMGESGNLKYGVPRLASAVTKALATEDQGALYNKAARYAVQESKFPDYAANAIDAREVE
ncbi:MAG: NAD(P)-binding domain-containing protein [Alphaproteobacteria bacterium]